VKAEAQNAVKTKARNACVTLLVVKNRSIYMEHNYQSSWPAYAESCLGAKTNPKTRKCSARHIGFITNHIKTSMILPQSLKIEFPGEKLSLVLNEWVPYILMTGSGDRILMHPARFHNISYRNIYDTPSVLATKFPGEKLSLVLNKWVPYILITGSDDRILMHPTETAQIDQQLDLVGQQKTWISRFSEFCTQQTFWNSKLVPKCSKKKGVVAGILTIIRFHEVSQVASKLGLSMSTKNSKHHKDLREWVTH
jgi:hypothetical protein